MRYNTLVIDPPWPISLMGQLKKRNRSTTLPYNTMTLEQIASFPIAQFLNQGAHVYLWTTNKYLSSSFDIFKSWGVRFHLVLVGVKSSGICPNMGYVFGTEFCLVGFYGSPCQKWNSIGQLNWFKIFNKAGRHSCKPDDFYTMVEKMSSPPYIDIFSRKNRKGWDSWGDEVGKFDGD